MSWGLSIKSKVSLLFITRGPVVLWTLTWNLVLVYFLILLYMYIAPGQEQTTPWGQMLMSTESPFVASFKTISTRFFFFFFFHVFFHMYIAPGRGRQTPRVKILMSTERPYHFDHLLQVLKKSLWTLILYTFFNVFYFHVYIAPG